MADLVRSISPTLVDSSSTYSSSSSGSDSVDPLLYDPVPREVLANLQFLQLERTVDLPTHGSADAASSTESLQWRTQREYVQHQITRLASADGDIHAKEDARAYLRTYVKVREAEKRVLQSLRGQLNSTLYNGRGRPRIPYQEAQQARDVLGLIHRALLKDVKGLEYVDLGGGTLFLLGIRPEFLHAIGNHPAQVRALLGEFTSTLCYAFDGHAVEPLEAVKLMYRYCQVLDQLRQHLQENAKVNALHALEAARPAFDHYPFDFVRRSLKSDLAGLEAFVKGIRDPHHLQVIRALVLAEDTLGEEHLRIVKILNRAGVERVPGLSWTVDGVPLLEAGRFKVKSFDTPLSLICFLSECRFAVDNCDEEDRSARLKAIQRVLKGDTLLKHATSEQKQRIEGVSDYLNRTYR